MNLDDVSKAYELLKNYKGDNYYINYLKNLKTPLNDFQTEYVICNYNFKPIFLNKIIKIASWFGEKKQQEWNIEFTPQKLFVGYFLGETKDFYHCYIIYRKSQEKAIPIFLPKSAVFTNIFVEDWTKKEIDFSKYEKLSGFELKPSQKRGIQFLTTRKRGILSLEMGLGKTMSSIVAALEADYKKILVICPASLKTQWKDEIARFISEDEISIVEGSKWKENRFTICNYDILKMHYTLPLEEKNIKQKDFTDDGKIQWSTVKKVVKTNKKSIVDAAMSESQLFQSHFDLIIIDEAHRLSNKGSKMYEIIEDLTKRLKPEGIYELTGTMVKNDPSNLFNMLKLLNSDVTKDWVYYHKTYCGAKQIFSNRKERDYYTNQFLKKKFKNEWKDLSYDEKQELDAFLAKNCKKIWIMGEAQNLDELAERIKHIYYREVNDLTKLGIKKEVKILNYDLTAEEKLQYDNAWEDFLETHEEKDLTKLISNHKLIEGAVFRQLISQFAISRTIPLAEKEIALGKKILIFCCFDKELYDLQEYFKDRCVIYNGKMTLKKKNEAIKKFKENDSVKVFIGNIAASNTGLNLNEACVIIFNNVSFVPAENNQCEFRCLRLGQNKDITVYYQNFVNTYTERLFEILNVKTEISNSIIKSESEK